VDGVHSPIRPISAGGINHLSDFRYYYARREHTLQAYGKAV
jgi:hypothetical protein